MPSSIAPIASAGTSLPAAEEARADGEGVGDVRLRAVHRRLDPADDTAADVGDEEALDAAEIEVESAHLRENLFPVV